MKNIVFDLGGVVFARDPRKSSREFTEFFSFVRGAEMPWFWVQYDRGTLTLDEVKVAICQEMKCSRTLCDDFIAQAIMRQEAISETKELIAALKSAGYRLYVLSNMSREFIDFLRQIDVYRLFDGEVVSCEEHVVKPEPAIYQCLINRYQLDPSQTLFIDDRASNLTAAARFGLDTYLFDYTDPAKSCKVLTDMLLA
ncbi:MAG: HAD family phosphatase [Alistipes sp.]